MFYIITWKNIKNTLMKYIIQKVTIQLLEHKYMYNVILAVDISVYRDVQSIICRVQICQIRCFRNECRTKVFQDDYGTGAWGFVFKVIGFGNHLKEGIVVLYDICIIHTHYWIYFHVCHNKMNKSSTCTL